ncbi:zinc ABC transporter substrate-binding protein [Halomonas sp. 18H]|uniref:zinc ABC transporter substrate-binding protein n=1 Tax=Halomonas almeriensis TaxID=308163 RepID=UPI002232818F|nr:MULTISPECIES: zinc ABC transporter substrate-binding protein [Halomonas]MCW4153798.1 zinc ABC transporter substrate-binding protein [Halomonas sp. 18H]MDN3553165.1 zinc ABC transporter substrate-binding protein [Halomonas almeriensis]
MLRVRYWGAALLGAGVPAMATAGVPDVAVDIPPLHSLVDRVMGDLGSPELVIQPGASPHGYSMRPSEAKALANADLVFWVGPELAPWLGESIDSLAADTDSVSLLNVEGTRTLDFRQGATFEAHDHAHEGHEHDHAHEGHDHHGHGHSHDGTDPHAWLDPANARVWLDAIAESLAKADPEHAETYQENARLGKAKLDGLIADLQTRLEGAQDTRFIVFHDAYQYFEKRFELAAAGAISLGDASDPSPARIDELRTTVTELGVDCVFSEPQFNPQLVDNVFGSTGVNTSIVIDPLGADLTPGEALYPKLLQQLAEGVAECASAT